MRRVVAMLGVAACGRVGFVPSGDGSPTTDTMARDGDADSGCLSSYELCDGFEGATLDTALWTVVGTGISLDTTVAHRGGSSLHVQSTALLAGQNAYFTVRQTKTLALGDKTFYVRAWLQFRDLPAGTNGMELIAASQSGAPSLGDFLFLHSGDIAIFTQFDEMSRDTGATPPSNTWFCALWTVTRDDSAGSITLGGDPPPVALANVVTDGTPAITEMDFGIGFASTNVHVAQPAMDLWIDDVIVDKSPATCAD